MEMNFEELANSKDWNDRYWVAKNPNCPIHLLEKLADDKDWLVRESVAKNPNCPQYLKDYIIMRFFISHSINNTTINLINHYDNREPISSLVKDQNETT
jgi:3-methyladenine DNA glycosylase AlkC